MTADKDYERRDGYSSSNKPSINKVGDGLKKKRPRVGDARTSNNSNRENQYSDNRSSTSRGGYNNSRESRNEDYSSDRRNNSSYRSNNSNYQSGGNRISTGRSNNNYNRPGGNDYNRNNDNNNRYSDDNRDRGYNNGGGGNNRGYNNGNSRGGYNNGNSRGGYNNNNRGNSNGASFQRNNDIKRPKQLVKPVKYKENLDPSTPIRLNKYLANAGVCSRREADAYITAGVVKVNGVTISELGAKVTRGDSVTFHDQPIRLESKVYVLLNKPKNTVTTSDDPQNRKTVMDLVKGACPERIYPVGRLDRNTTGVLLLTNDGDLASKLMHPKYDKKKIYQVKLDRDVAIEDMQAIADGIELEDGEIHADSIAYVAEDILDEVGIEIHSGRNRIVRRIFEKLGYQVLKLDRVYFAGLTKKNITKGRWRYLTESEVNMLRMGAFE